MYIQGTFGFLAWKFWDKGEKFGIYHKKVSNVFQTHSQPLTDRILGLDGMRRKIRVGRMIVVFYERLF